MRIGKIVCKYLFLVILALVFNSAAFALETGTVNNAIQGGHSGAWYNVTEPGHGLFIEVLESNDSPTGKQVLVAWYAYLNGQQTWLLGQGNVVAIEGGYKAMLDAYIYQGNDFPPFYDPEMTVQESWGTMELAFTGCDMANLKWESVFSGFGSGELELRRLTTIADSVCLPGLGGEAKTDDHGDTWQSGTYLTDIGRVAQEIKGRLEERGDVDVFVFTLPSSLEFTAFTAGPGDTDSVGTLYELVNYEEIEIAESDENPIDFGFKIKEDLDAGTYSLHVTGQGGQERGEYYLYYKAEGN